MTSRLAVVKLGGSVLADAASLDRAVHELYRWWRGGSRVVAVVSALSRVTARLVARCEAEGLTGHAAAELLASGESASAALLAQACERAGVPACVLGPAALGLVAEGDPRDGFPVALDPAAIDRAHARDEIVIVPGWCGLSRDGRAIVFGRGGSDLTALFLAHRLGRGSPESTTCRLVKDVDGLFERDPRADGPTPRRYALATFDDALATDGSIVQHKAVQFAARHDLPFELGAWMADRPTLVRRGRSCFAAPVPRPPPLRVVLLGLGAVGGALLERLVALPDRFDIVAAAVRDTSRSRKDLPRGVTLHDDAVAAAALTADVVVELLGGVDVAGAAVRAALSRGTSVVTANKALIAEQGPALQALARARGGRLVHAAAVGGAMPLLERLAACDRGQVRSVRGVLNGTTNAVLDRIASGATLEDAVAAARDSGWAEADASRDLAGRDAAEKLVLVARALRMFPPPVEHVPCDVLDAEHVAVSSSRAARRVRQVAELTCDEAGVRLSVTLAALDPGDPLAEVRGVDNQAVITLADGSTRVVKGRGAGGLPTAEAVLADLLALAACGRRPSVAGAA